MKTKLSVVLFLTAICVLLITAGTGTSHAQPPQLTPQAYLPIISVPCLRETSAYMTANAPLIHVGETLTVTGAIVNECSRMVGQPYFGVWTQPTEILTPTWVLDVTHTSVGPGHYLMFTVTLQAISTGSVTLAGGVGYETLNDDVPPGYYWNSVAANSIVVRVMPDLP
jgi:hypothetical protein